MQANDDKTVYFPLHFWSRNRCDQKEEGQKEEDLGQTNLTLWTRDISL